MENQKVIHSVKSEIDKKNEIQKNILETLKKFDSRINVLSDEIKTLNELILSLPSKLNESYIIL